VRIKFADITLVMLALTNHSENCLVADLLRSMGYQGKIAAVVRHEEHADQLTELGISAFNLYGQAGTGFAAHVSDLLDESQEDAAAGTGR
jgi:glutathione-regulated potassium-efflux system ancillary protein KefC